MSARRKKPMSPQSGSGGKTVVVLPAPCRRFVQGLTGVEVEPWRDFSRSMPRIKAGDIVVVFPATAKLSENERDDGSLVEQAVARLAHEVKVSEAKCAVMIPSPDVWNMPDDDLYYEHASVPSEPDRTESREGHYLRCTPLPADFAPGNEAKKEQLRQQRLADAKRKLLSDETRRLLQAFAPGVALRPHDRKGWPMVAQEVPGHVYFTRDHRCWYALRSGSRCLLATWRAPTEDAVVALPNVVILPFSRERLSEEDVANVGRLLSVTYELQRDVIDGLGTPREECAGPREPTRPHRTFDVEPGTEWKQVTIEMIGDDALTVSLPGRKPVRANYAELDFVDKRKSLPNKLWIALKAFAEKGGEVALPRDAKKKPLKPKRVSDLRQHLRALFPGIHGDPIEAYDRRDRCYRTRFRIRMRQ